MVLALLLAALVAAPTLGLGPLRPGEAGAANNSSTSGSWSYPNADLANNRDAIGSGITSANVSTLKKAWSFTLKGPAATSVSGAGTVAAGPIVVNGVVYIQDLHSNVYALSLATGKLEWQYIVNKKELSGPGPNGVALANGMVYAASPTTVFALNAKSGHVIWTDKDLLKKGQGTFGIQPQAANGRLYLASQYGIASGGGILLALEDRTQNEYGRDVTRSRGGRRMGDAARVERRISDLRHWQPLPEHRVRAVDARQVALYR
jgi:glucose dehydrogenase